MKRATVPNTDWQRGYSLEWLKRITAVVDAHDKGLILGAFTRTSERTVADWRARGWLSVFGEHMAPTGILVEERVSRPRRWVDFAGEPAATIPAGALLIRKIAGDVSAYLRGKRPDGPVYFEGWMESDADRTFAEEMGLVCHGVKVRASSELWGLFGPSEGLDENEGYCLPPDWPALRKLTDGLAVRAAARAVSERPPKLADHYSGYNVKHSWSAAVLRGYGGLADFIIKPSEMSKKWKEDNKEKMDWVIADTPLRAAYPELEPLIEQVPGVKHRIRLMNLAPGGGELKRHADITDPDAGTRDGRLCRVHIPLKTNPGVRFTSWRLDGLKVERHMAAGEMWYLDTRKPHTAVNNGDTARLHLVLDVESSPALRRMLVN